MYKYKCIILFFILIMGFLFCKSEDPNSPLKSKFIIQVDSVHVENTVNLNDTLTFRFWGVIGSNLCYLFQSFEVHTEPQQIDFILWGYNTGGDICATAISKLDGKEYKYVPQNKGMLLITINQPDNSACIDSVLVE